MPATSEMTNYLNIAIEVSYLVIEGVFFGYFKLIVKDISGQFGFGITLVILEATILAVVFIWMVYRFSLVVKDT
jgi:hypothetical protein